MAYTDNSIDYMTKVRSKVSQNMGDLISEYRKDLQEMLDTPPSRSGTPYYSYQIGSMHTPSAKGEPPAPLTRNLIRSITSGGTRQSLYKVRGYVTSDAPYAAILEQEMNRPAWKRTILANASKYYNILTQGFGGD